MVTQYACDKPASWPFNVIKPSVAKKDLLSQSLEWYMHCVVLVTFARAENINKTSVQANLRIPKIMVLWQAVFLPASPLVTAHRQISLDFITTAPPPNLTRLLHNTASCAGHSVGSQET